MHAHIFNAADIAMLRNLMHRFRCLANMLPLHYCRTLQLLDLLADWGNPLHERCLLCEYEAVDEIGWLGHFGNYKIMKMAVVKSLNSFIAIINIYIIIQLRC